MINTKTKNAIIIRILPIIVISQFAGTSLWFAGNAIISNLQQEFNLQADVIGYITSAVQFGFITGTLIFALLTISDRFSPSKVFLFCALAGALANVGIISFAKKFYTILLFRFLTGFFLAGIYPVGMKLAADWHEKGLGKALGYLVGALVIGTAFPHLLREITHTLPWKYVLIFTSVVALSGGFLIYFFVPDGPFRRKSQQLNLKAFAQVFSDKEFRSAAFGYFGHMWELYTFWAFVPVILMAYNNFHPDAQLSISLFSFLIIASGGVACVFGGYLSQKYGSGKVAFAALLISCCCCIISVFMFRFDVFPFLIFLFIWGLAVVADSPQFSALIAQTAPKNSIGTALTIVTCIGFAITIISIQFISFISNFIPVNYLYIFLAIGPVLGLIPIFKLLERRL